MKIADGQLIWNITLVWLMVEWLYMILCSPMLLYLFYILNSALGHCRFGHLDLNNSEKDGKGAWKKLISQVGIEPRSKRLRFKKLSLNQLSYQHVLPFTLTVTCKCGICHLVAIIEGLVTNFCWQWDTEKSEYQNRKMTKKDANGKESIPSGGGKARNSRRDNPKSKSQSFFVWALLEQELQDWHMSRISAGK